MSPGPAISLVLLTVGLYPIVTGAIWIAGGLLYKIFDEPGDLTPPKGGWPGVTVLVPAYNEELVIATCVRATRELDYPELEVLVLDDGSKDGTVDAAGQAADGDPRVEVVRDPVNRGKAGRLNLGFERARHELVVVTDSDTHIHPLALKLLVARITRSPMIAAVAGAPHVTNRLNYLCAMQILEVSAVIGLIRRTQALAGRVAVVAGVLGLFRRDAVLAVGGYREDMATEDIELSWRLLLAGWHTSYEPDALVGMQVPTTLRSLWAQRRRWARGQGEVLNVHGRELIRWRNRSMWPIALESAASLAWIVALVLVEVLVFMMIGITGWRTGQWPVAELFLSWGIAVAVVATIQLAFALEIDFPYDRLALLAFLLGPLYPVAHWLVSASAALREEIIALVRGPAERRVVWDIAREGVGTDSRAGD